MSRWNPKAWWEELVRAILGSADERDDPAADPTFLFHMLFTAPLLIGLLLMARRA